jgi:two-component system chemotaxis sensor kinase CheA
MDDDLLNDYLAEAEDILVRVEEILDELSSRSVLIEDIDDLFRSIHTIKGGAGMFGWSNTQNVGHDLETYLGKCKTELSKFNYDFVRERVDIITNLLENNDEGDLDSLSENQLEETAENSINHGYCSVYFADFVHNFDELLDLEISSGKLIYELKVPLLVNEKIKKFLKNIKADILSESEVESFILLLLSVPNECVNEKLISQLERIGDFNEITKGQEEEVGTLVVNINQAAIEIDSSDEAHNPEKNKAVGNSKKDLLRVPTSKLNEALNSVWEIFLLRNQIAYLFEKNKDFLKKNIDMVQEWEILDNALKRNISELESTTMSMRMNDLSSLFSRMQKVVRSYQKNCGKEINFITEGDDIELDKKIIDMLGEPLIHLVRNAMDHGIETAEVRQASQKPKSGTISLKAVTQSDKVIIELVDDGKGIDGKKILKKAQEKGLDTTNIKTDEDAIDLIFSPGFSTAEEVTDVSGRGVGMDAVRRSIQKIGGEVFIETTVGKGSSFKIELPLSMSVVSSILYEINGKTYGSSINNLIEVCRESEDELHINGKEVFFSYRGDFIECYDLRDHFDGEQSEKDNKNASYCILEMNSKKVAMRVDRVFKHTEIVVKEMKGVFPDINFVNGISILATGEPIFVVSLTKLYRNFKEGGMSHAA